VTCVLRDKAASNWTPRLRTSVEGRTSTPHG